MFALAAVRLNAAPLMQFGLNPYRFNENEDISQFYEMLTTSPDKAGQVRPVSKGRNPSGQDMWPCSS